MRLRLGSGDLDGTKGVYHVNAVDEVTQWQVLGATAQISEAWLLPGAGSDDRTVSVSHPRLSLRQRQRVHQPYGGQATGEAAGGTDRSEERRVGKECRSR